eukprot:261772-Pyramimonas_sp.AAC.1
MSWLCADRPILTPQRCPQAGNLLLEHCVGRLRGPVEDALDVAQGAKCNCTSIPRMNRSPVRIRQIH